MRSRLPRRWSDFHPAGLPGPVPPGRDPGTAAPGLVLRLPPGCLGGRQPHGGGPGAGGPLRRHGPGKAHRAGGSPGFGPGLVRVFVPPGAHRRPDPPRPGHRRGRHLPPLLPGTGRHPPTLPSSACWLPVLVLPRSPGTRARCGPPTPFTGRPGPWCDTARTRALSGSTWRLAAIFAVSRFRGIGGGGASGGF